MSFAACAPVSTGSGFLKGSIAYLDCAGREIGSVGYTALAQPGSVISQLILAAITLFIAWQGIRMMFGHAPGMGEAVMAVAKIGLVLMLVTSWPAVRTLFSEPAFAGSGELVEQTGIQGTLPLEDRLQRADDGIVALTKWGSGKLDIRVGQTADGQPAATAFSGVALTDNLALGLGRLSFLISALMSIGLLKLLTGVMISALPIFAGLLLFEASRSLFWGWLRLVFALFVASFAIPLLLTTELSLLEPWLTRAIEQRSAFYATPSAPTELLAMTGSFLLILIGSTALIVKSCFRVDFAAFAGRIRQQSQSAALTEVRNEPALKPAPAVQRNTQSRAEGLALTMAQLDQMPRQSGSIDSVPAGSRRSDNDIDRPAPGRGPISPGRSRARQRVALSHARRNKL